MPKYTTPQALWNIITELQSVGGTQYEGNIFVSNTLRYVNSEQGIDVEYENRVYGDGMDVDGLEQLNPTPLPVSQQGGDVVEDRDRRKSLGTFPISNRGFWEDINFNPSTLQPHLTNDLRKTVKTKIVSIPDDEGKMVYKDIKDGQTDREYSIDALVFVTDPNNDGEIVRVDKYYDKEINPNEYELATEGKINYYLYPRVSGRISSKSAVDVYKPRGKKVVTGGGPPHQFDNKAQNNIQRKNEGYFIFNLNWGDGTQNEYSDKPKLLESSVIFEHTYEKPGFYTITGTVFNSNGFHIDQYERFETRILLNASAKYLDELDLFRHRNFVMIGGISPSSTLIKSVSSAVGLDPFDFSNEKTKDDLLTNYNELDKIELLNLMNMISSNSIVDYEEKYINPYSKVIDNEPTPLLDIPEVLGCMDTNADNYVGYATVNNGCYYSYLITGNINGLGGKEPIFFIGEIDDGGGIKDRYFLFGGAYADWNGVVTQISTNEFSGNKFALIIAPSTIYPELGSSDDVPFDGWTIPDGLRIGKINYSDEGTPIVEQTSGNDLPGTLSGQGYGYEVDVPVSPYENVDGNDRVYILTIDPNNPPGETNYTDKEVLVNWSGDTEDVGELASGLGETLFYAVVETEVLDGDGTIEYLDNLAHGQSGILAGDVIEFIIDPSANQRINHLYYNGEEIMPGDSRITYAYNSDNQNFFPISNSYEEGNSGLMWGENVTYKITLTAETDNKVEAIFSEMSPQDELFGENYVSYDTVAVAIFNSPAPGPSGVRFEPSIGLNLVQSGQGVPSQFQGSYVYNYQVQNQYGVMVDYNPNYNSVSTDYVVVTNQPINNGPYYAKFDRDFMNQLNDDLPEWEPDSDFGYSWMGWFSKSPNDPTFDIEADLLSTDDEYEFYTIYNEGEGVNNEEQYFPTLIDGETFQQIGGEENIGPVLAVYAYVKYVPNINLVRP